MNTGMVYATNLTIGTPWSALPTYWPQLLGTVDAINKTHPSFLLNRNPGEQGQCCTARPCH